MSVKEIKQDDLKWIHISKINDEAILYLKKTHKFHHLDFEDIQSESQNPKLDVYDNYIFLVFHFPQWKQNTRKVVPHEVDFFVGPNYLITVQHGKNSEIKDFFYRCMNNKKLKNSWMTKSSGFLLYKVLETMFNQSRPMLNSLGKQISSIENDIFAGEQDLQEIKELAMLRRDVLSFRRMLDPQRYLVSTLSHTRKTFLDESLSIYFDNIKDYLDKLWVIADTYKETIDGLHLTVESLVNQKTNKVIGALTAISVSLLPLTLLSGIYGMNIAGLPHANNPKWVWFMFIGLATVIILSIVVMKRKKWL